MKLKSQAEIDAVFGRFYQCHDGLIKSVQIGFQSPRRSRREIVADVKDSKSSRGDGWSCVRIIVHDVQEFRVAEEYGYEIQVCNFGIFAHMLQQKVAIQFGYTIDESGSLAGIRKSEGYAVGVVARRANCGSWKSCADEECDNRLEKGCRL